MADDKIQTAKLFSDISRFMICFPGLIYDKADFSSCMQEKDIRTFYGNVLYYEVMPTSHCESSIAEAAAYTCTQELEKDHTSLVSSLASVLECRDAVIDFIRGFEADQQLLPLGLCFGLTACILSLAGIRRNNTGYEMMVGDKPESVHVPEEAGETFCRLSVDMPAESLAYAALSDMRLWGCDLRNIAGLEDKITGLITSVQINGLRSAMTDLDIKGQW